MKLKARFILVRRLLECVYACVLIRVCMSCLETPRMHGFQVSVFDMEIYFCLVPLPWTRGSPSLHTLHESWDGTQHALSVLHTHDPHMILNTTLNNSAH